MSGSDIAAAKPVRHAEPSLLFSLDDDPWGPSPRLFQLSAMLAAFAPHAAHPLLAARNGGGPRWHEQFPGEHYHLLTTLCDLLKPTLVWEFGTDAGMSTVALLEGLGPQGRIVTVDLDDWRSRPGPWLTEEDVASGRVTQMVCDMTSDAVFVDGLDSLREAELIFVDGPKDGRAERAFLDRLAGVRFVRDPVVVFDDIRLMNMVHVWRGIDRPKMDVTSFGHWSGTGLVDWIAPPPVSPEVSRPVPAAGRFRNILMLCDEKPNYVPDLLLHGLRKLLGPAVVDFPRKDSLCEGRLGQSYLDPVPGLMAADGEVDRDDIAGKLARGFFDLALCDIRAASAHRDMLRDSRCPLALIDGEDRPVSISPGKHAILRRETDGGDYSIPLPMALPAEILDWIDRHADAPKTRGLGFLGSRSGLTPERNAILDQVSRRFPDALINSWDVSGGGWQGRDAYYRAMQGCVAVLNLPGAGLDTFRYWENAACNAAHVAMRMKLFIPDDFRDGLEIARFSDVDELSRLIERLLSDQIDWRDMSARSRQWLRAHHTTERRAAATLARLAAAFPR